LKKLTQNGTAGDCFGSKTLKYGLKITKIAYFTIFSSFILNTLGGHDPRDSPPGSAPVMTPLLGIFIENICHQVLE